jgi:hypothetical protein
MLLFQFPSGLHHQPPRKRASIPYIAHLMSVCGRVREAGGDEDQAIASLLHHAVEDEGGLSTLGVSAAPAECEQGCAAGFGCRQAPQCTSNSV